MPKKVDHKSKRDAFVAATHRTVRKKGVAAATVREIAKEAGYTTGALVHYVDSVRDLLVEAYESSAKPMREDLSAIERLPDSLEALRQVLHLSLPADPERKNSWDFLIGLWERRTDDPAALQRMQDRIQQWYGRTTRLIRAAQAAGDIAADVDALCATRAIGAMIEGLVLQILRTGRPMPPGEQHDLIDLWIVNWLKPSRPLAGGSRPPQS